METVEVKKGYSRRLLLRMIKLRVLKRIGKFFKFDRNYESSNKIFLQEMLIDNRRGGCFFGWDDE